jgi:hypothetical protein
MAIYAISDLHLSFNTDKPMNIFGWINHEEKIKESWKENINENDLVLLPGDFSWEMALKDTYKDFDFINNLPGKKLLLKGNHDLWWTSLKKMNEYVEENFKDIGFIYNNSFLYEDKIIVGTRGWTLLNPNDEDNKKIVARETLRLEMSIKDGIAKYGDDKEIICMMHYPPLIKDAMENSFVDVLKKYNIKTCLYGHLHGKAQEGLIEGIHDGINYIMVSCDYTNFKVVKICD